MVNIVYQRNKCIGCNACVEAAPDRWRVSKKDGRCHLIGGVENKGFYTLKVDIDEYEENALAAKNCPQNIIRVDLL